MNYGAIASSGFIALTNIESVSNTIFTQISTATLIKFFVPQMRHLIKGAAYSKAALI